MKKHHYCPLVLSMITLAATVYFFLASCMTELPTLFFNSDQLYSSYFYKNLIINHGHFQHWFFSADMFFFPDAILFFFVAYAVKSFALTLLLCEAVILIVYYVLLVSVGKLIAGDGNKNLFRISALLLLMLAGTYFGEQELFKPVFMHHFSTNVVIYLLGIFLILKTLHTKKIAHRIFFISLLSGICLFTTFSDPMFFVIFFSVLLSLLILGKNRILYVLIALILFFACLLGFLANTYDWLHWHILFNVQAEAWHHTWLELFKNFLLNSQRYITFRQVFSIFYTHNPITCLILLAFFLMGNKILWNVFFGQSRHKLKTFIQTNDLSFAASFVLISLTLCIYISVFAGLFLDPGLLLGAQGLVLRHFQTMIILSVFLGVPVLLAQFERISQLSNQYFIPITSLILITMFLFAPFYSLKPAVNYYPPLTACLDNYVNNGELISPNGITGYWDAHVNDVLSKSRLNLVAVTGDLAPFDWLSTTEDYKNKKFNFFLVRDGAFSENAVQAVFGKPNKTLVCPNVNNYHIYVYNQGFSIKKSYFSLSNATHFSNASKWTETYPIVTNSPYINIKGFGANESEPGLWTNGKNAGITLYLTKQKLSEHPTGYINFYVFPFLYAGIDAQRLDIRWGNNQKTTEAVATNQWVSISYTTRDWKEVTPDGSLQKIQIQFHLPHAMAPADLTSDSLDYRQLGVRFLKFSFTSNPEH